MFKFRRRSFCATKSKEEEPQVDGDNNEVVVKTPSKPSSSSTSTTPTTPTSSKFFTGVKSIRKSLMGQIGERKQRGEEVVGGAQVGGVEDDQEELQVKRSEEEESPQITPQNSSPQSHSSQTTPHYCPESERDLERNLNYYGNQKKPHRRKRHREKSEPAAIPIVTIEEIIAPKEEKCGFLEALQGGDPLLSPRSSTTHPPTNPHLLSLSHTPSPMDLPPSPPMAQMDAPPIRRLLYAETEAKLNELTREMSVLKRNLKRFEGEYETIFGYRPSYADKLGNKEMKKCLLGVARVKRELGALHDSPQGIPQNPAPQKSLLTSLTTTVTQIPLSTTPPALMTPVELQEEKNHLQRQLLILERKHGRPTKKEEKEIVRELYERYREVKRWGRKSGNGGKFLGVVPENGVLELEESEVVGKAKVLEVNMDLEIEGVAVEIGNHGDVDEEEDDEEWMKMDLPTLTTRLTTLRDEKRSLRSQLRRFESDFVMTTGRRPGKEDKSTETCYQRYKKIKKTIRLLEVLVNKK